MRHNAKHIDMLHKRFRAMKSVYLLPKSVREDFLPC